MMRQGDAMNSMRLLSLCLALAWCSSSTLAKELQTTFTTAYSCGSKPSEGTCLSEPFEPGRVVILLKKDSSGVCISKTEEKYKYEGVDRYYEGTKLGSLDGCFGPFNFAIVGADPSFVRLTNEKISSSVLDKRRKQARELLKRREASFPATPETEQFRVSDIPPKVIVAGHNVLLSYTLKMDSTFGPSVLFLNDRHFVSESKEWCATGHTFFYVKDKLHLGYFEAGCGGGYSAAIIKDLSSGTPKEVYVRGRTT